MDNQHKKIKGYRDLSEEEIALMNEVKEMAAKVGELTHKMERMANTSVNVSIELDYRWLAIGTTDLQKGFMFLVRSVARPTTF